MANDPESLFSARLREVTRADHAEAETAEFITTLMNGSRSARDYALLLSQYTYIYAQLESSVAALRSDPELEGFFDEHLERSASLKLDLGQLLPAVGLEELPEALPATRNYVRRISEVGRGNAARLVGHHYLRYLGDLSGGLAIGRLVSRHYGIPGGQLNMWRFDGIEKPKVYKDEYRAKLDAFAVDDQRADDLVDEAGIGFNLNKALFGELLQQSTELSGLAA